MPSFSRTPDTLLRPLLSLLLGLIVVLFTSGCGGSSGGNDEDDDQEDTGTTSDPLEAPDDPGALSAGIDTSPWNIPTDNTVVYDVRIVDPDADPADRVTDAYLFRRHRQVTSPVDSQTVVAVDSYFVKRADWDGTTDYATIGEFALSDNGWVYARSVIYTPGGPVVELIDWQGVLPPTKALSTIYIGGASAQLFPAGVHEITATNAVDPTGRAGTLRIEPVPAFSGGAQSDVYWLPGSGTTSYFTESPNGATTSYTMRSSPPTAAAMHDG